MIADQVVLFEIVDTAIFLFLLALFLALILPIVFRDVKKRKKEND